MSDTTTNTKKIAELNDLCRTAMGVAGRLFQTDGIDALPSADQSAIREKVETFDAFTHRTTIRTASGTLACSSTRAPAYFGRSITTTTP